MHPQQYFCMIIGYTVEDFFSWQGSTRRLELREEPFPSPKRVIFIHGATATVLLQVYLSMLQDVSPGPCTESLQWFLLWWPLQNHCLLHDPLPSRGSLIMGCSLVDRSILSILLLFQMLLSTCHTLTLCQSFWKNTLFIEARGCEDMAGVHYFTWTGGIYGRGTLLKSQSQRKSLDLSVQVIFLGSGRGNAVGTVRFCVTSDFSVIYKYSSHYHFFQH